MKPYWQDNSGVLYLGDSLEVLRELPSESLDCCITSPPYWGLRDYGVEGQFGLEKTPEEYVAKMVEVFREVRRTLKSTGVLFLNLGDSYYSDLQSSALKPKDLCGIPWRVAFALQQPYYAGEIKDEKDRVWLAAMLDAEGCLTMSEYETGGKSKSNIYISITNSSRAIIDNCERIFPQEIKHIYEKADKVNRVVWRWDVEQIDKKMRFIREIYPYLVAKKKQATLAYSFLLLQKGLPSKKKGYLPAQIEQRKILVGKIQQANSGVDVELPDWTTEPPSLLEEGFYLRQDIIWAKPNPMPESVIDRCTKSHEYIFLLAKSQKYYFDNEAIMEPIAKSTIVRCRTDFITDDNVSKRKHFDPITPSINPNTAEATRQKLIDSGKRNKRSVWTVTTKPYAEAHFATFPPDLITPMVKAGCPVGGVVLDPFMGSGTTAWVAKEFGRRYVGIDLNQKYLELCKKRLGQEVLFPAAGKKKEG